MAQGGGLVAEENLLEQGEHQHLERVLDIGHQPAQSDLTFAPRILPGGNRIRVGGPARGAPAGLRRYHRPRVNRLEAPQDLGFDKAQVVFQR